MFCIKRPTELVDVLSYLEAYAPNFPEEDQCTTATVFGEVFAARQLFVENTPTDEGKERVRQCERNLRVAFEDYEHGDELRGAQLLRETGEMFRKARKYIAVSDE
jgi:hypothetical protein